MKQTGMTLTSVLVAVALTSALATAVSKLVSNQAKLNKVMQLTDQRDMITRFYSALMHNRVVWMCTLYDSSNRLLSNYISGTTSSFSDKVELRTPDCKFKEEHGTHGIAELKELTDSHGIGDHYRSSGAFFTTNPMMLGESITEHNADGWWQVGLTAVGVAKGSIDLTLTISFDEDNYKRAHAGFDPPDIRDTVEYKVRKGDPNVQGIAKDCGNKAVVAIDDLTTGVRGVTCSDDYLVDVPDVGTDASGNFLHTLADGSDDRVGSAADTDDRTGLRIGSVWPFAITNITDLGDYQLARVEGAAAAGVLTSHCSNFVTMDGDKYTLHGISGTTGSLTYSCSYNLGPTGKQGPPGELGYQGERGDPGDPAPPCP